MHPQDQLLNMLQALNLSQKHQDDLQPIAEQPIPIFKYGIFIRKMVPNQELILPAIGLPWYIGIKASATSHPLYKKYAAEGLISRSQSIEAEHVLAIALEADIRQQLAWSLCQDFMESVEELFIPLTDIQRYVDHAHQFKSSPRLYSQYRKRYLH
jgi:hypothetical protein